MTETSRPWTGRTSEGAPGDSGAYSDDQWQQMYKHMIGTGAEQANRGVLSGILEELEVVANSPADTTIIVEPGSALAQGIFYLNDADKSVSIASNASGSTRIDIIVLEADYTAQKVRIDVVLGTPGAGVPALTQSVGSIWQIPLAYLTLASGYASIPQTLITDWREYANIPNAIGIDVTNSSGITLEQGAAVIWLAAGGLAVDDTTVEGNINVAGIIERRVLNGGEGRVIVHGVIPIMCDELVAVGDVLVLSTTAGQAQKATNNNVNGFARVLTANTGAGTRCLAYVNVAHNGRLNFAQGSYTGNGAATQAITGLGFQPRAVYIYITADGAFTGDQVWKAEIDGLFAKYPGNYEIDYIVSLDAAGGFTVGDGTGGSAGNVLNVSARTYTYIAWR